MFKKIRDCKDINYLGALVLGFSGIWLNIMGFVIALFDGTPIFGVLVIGVCLFLLITITLISFKKKKYGFYKIFASFVVCNLLFPVIFVATGGIEKSFILYFFIASVAYGVSMDKKWFFIFPAITILEYNYVIVRSYNSLSELFMFNENIISILCGFDLTFLFIFFYVCYFTTRAKKFTTELGKLVFHDDLTQLYNRRKLSEDLLGGNYHYGAMIDIDDFSICNNNFGHQYGDIVLKKLAKICIDIAGDQFKVYRYGGEELFVLSRFNKEITLKKLLTIKERFQKECEQTISIGVAEQLDYEPYQKLIKNADENMYAVKKNGKNAIFFEEFYR